MDSSQVAENPAENDTFSQLGPHVPAHLLQVTLRLPQPAASADTRVFLSLTHRDLMENSH